MAKYLIGPGMKSWLAQYSAALAIRRAIRGTNTIKLYQELGLSLLISIVSLYDNYSKNSR